MYSIMSSANSDSFTSFKFGFILFYFLCIPYVVFIIKLKYLRTRYEDLRGLISD